LLPRFPNSRLRRLAPIPLRSRPNPSALGDLPRVAGV